MGSQDQKTFHWTLADSAQASQKIDGKKESKNNTFSFAHRDGIAITERAADGNAFAESDGFSHTECNANSAEASEKIDDEKEINTDTFSFTECDGFSHTEPNDNSAADGRRGRAISRTKRDYNA